MDYDKVLQKLAREFLPRDFREVQDEENFAG